MPSSLQHELGKQQPFDLPEQEAALSLWRTADQLGRPFRQLFEKHGLSQAGYNVLRIVRGHGSDGVRCRDIGGQMVTHSPDVTRLVDRLCDAGHVERIRSEQDRRVVFVRLTKQGGDLLDQLDDPVRDLHRDQLGHLDESELQTLSSLLAKARTAVGHR